MTTQIFLASVPVANRLRLFQCECWKEKVRKGSLPSQRLGFIQCQAKQVFIRTYGWLEFRKDRLLQALDLRENLAAAFEAGIGDPMSSRLVGFNSIDVRFHISFHLVVVHLVKFECKK